ncbi:MAG: saccharopine dehydrogenase C-terminal domain-containing protein [Longimicrobiales bacterium]
MNLLVLGAGRVGAAIARDLAADPDFAVTVADRSEAALARVADRASVRTQRIDLMDARALATAARAHDLVVGAVPGSMGFATLRTVIGTGTDTVDISFFEEDALELDALARERGVRALVDCGLAPGCSNLILGHLEATLDDTERFVCVVGGLPVHRSWPFEYKAPFSPADVLEEYTRPARLRRDGRDITLPALSELELIDFPEVGTLEAFNTDGLRTLLRTARTPTMAEKTLRYPGHAELMRIFRETGFFDTEPVALEYSRIVPRQLTARLLFDAWRFAEGEEDLTIMRAEVIGRAAGERVRHTFELFDRYDRQTGVSSMARTTGYTCTAMVRLLADDRFTDAGVAPPELVARVPGCFDYILDHLRRRAVTFRHTVTPLSDQ